MKIIILSLIIILANIHIVKCEENTVQKFTDKEILIGDEQGFRLDDNITIEEMLAMKIRIAGDSFENNDFAKKHYEKKTENESWVIPYLICAKAMNFQICIYPYEFKKTYYSKKMTYSDCVNLLALMFSRKEEQLYTM